LYQLLPTFGTNSATLINIRATVGGGGVAEQP